ncbi:tripartite tricarboxylate transporter substrate binding protein [soil metagenome]
MKRRTLAGLLLMAVESGTMTAAMAQTYPDHPIRVVLPYPAGGNTDLVMREIAKALGPQLGQTVIVDNKAGANGIIGTDAVAKAAPDGYTLLTAIGAFAINPAIYKSLPYTPEQLTPISLLGRVNLILAVGSQVPAKTFPELVAYAKTGAQISYDSSGVGSALHLVGERISATTGMKALHVPYKGISQSMPDIVSGRLTFTINTIATLGPFIRDGKLVPLAVLGNERTPQLAGVPTIIEAGFPNLEAYAWQCLIAPTCTPRPVIDLLAAKLAAVAKTPEMRARLAEMGLDAVGSTPAEFKAFIQDDMVKAAAVVKQAGIVAE